MSSPTVLTMFCANRKKIQIINCYMFLVQLILRLSADDFLFSRHLSGLQHIDIVRRNLMSITFRNKKF